MALRLELQTDTVQVMSLPDGQLQVRTIVQDVDGSSVYHRKVIAPGDYAGDEVAEVQAIVARIHTSETVTAFRQSRGA